MKKTLFFTLIVAVAFLFGSTLVFAGGGSAPEPPGQPETGYGSPENYICSGYTEVEIGDGNAGTRIWYYIPDVLKNGSSAPVVVILHGFMLLAPDIYLGHITHLTNQGYIVLYPQFNLGGFSGMLSDNDQNDMLARAIDAVDWALDEIGSIAETDNITMFGHSLGGLLAMCWEAGGGIPIESKVLAAPCIDTGAAPSFVNVIVLDYETMAPSSTCPVMIIVGDQEAESGQVSVRQRGEGDLGKMDRKELFKRIKEDVDKKK